MAFTVSAASSVDLSVPFSSQSIHKKNHVFRRARGHFLQIKCEDCNSQTVCYTHSQKDIRCPGCATLLLKPAGGRATVVGKIGVRRAMNDY